MMQHNKFEGMPIALKSGERFADRMRRIAARNLKEASMEVTARSTESAGWYCLHVAKGREFAVEKDLQEANVEVFTPREKVLLVRQGKRIEVETPVLPGYLLVRCVPSAAAFQGLKRQRYVVDIIGGSEGRYHVVRDEVVSIFKRMGSDNAPRVATDKSFKDGDRADIVVGPFTGFMCTVLAVKWCRQAKARVVISMDGRAFEIDSMPLAFLKKL